MSTKQAVLTTQQSYERPLTDRSSYVLRSQAKNSVPVTGKNGKGEDTPLYRGGVIPLPLPTPAAPRSVDQVLEEIKTWTPAQQESLLAKLSLELSTRADSTQQRDQEMWSGALYEALVASNGDHAGGLPAPMLLKRAVASPTNWKVVRDFMDDSKMSRLSVQERQVCYGLLAKLVVDRAEFVVTNWDVPMSAKLIGDQQRHLHSLFDQAFPGYLRSGLALVVARSLVKPKKKAACRAFSN